MNGGAATEPVVAGAAADPVPAAVDVGGLVLDETFSHEFLAGHKPATRWFELRPLLLSAVPGLSSTNAVGVGFLPFFFDDVNAKSKRALVVGAFEATALS